MDKLSKAARSTLMAKVGAKNTAPELLVRHTLFKMGYRYRLHAKHLPGRPDIVLPKHRTVIFVHGCFWHGHDCPKGTKLPVNNKDFWVKKLSDNKARDVRNTFALEKLGWKVLIVWECQTKTLSQLTTRLSENLLRSDSIVL